MPAAQQSIRLELQTGPSNEGGQVHYRLREGRKWREFASVLELAAYLEKLVQTKDSAGGLK